MHFLVVIQNLKNFKLRKNNNKKAKVTFRFTYLLDLYLKKVLKRHKDYHQFLTISGPRNCTNLKMYGSKNKSTFGYRYF